MSAWLALGGAAALLLLDLALSVALLAAAGLNRVTLRRLAQEAGPSFGFLETFKTPLSPHRTAAQMVRQVCLLGASGLVGVGARALGAARPWAMAAAFGGLVGVLLVETFAARLLSQRDPRLALRLTAPLVPLLRWLLAPVVAPLLALLRLTVREDPADADDREEEQEEEVEAFLEVGEREGILEGEEGKMMRSIVDIGETRVREIMTPRTDVLALTADTSVAQARRSMIDAGHSRMPVYRGSIDDVVGILHVRDLVRAWEQGKEASTIASFLRPAFFVPETLSVAELLAEMRVRTHLAIVVDEYGGVAGLVTLEDLLEEIVGDIRDEHDLEEALVVEESDGSWLVNGLAHVEEIETLFGLDLEDREFDTVGGLVVASAGRVPEQGEVLEVQGLSIEVVHADPRRVYRVRIRRTTGSAPVEATA